MRRTVNVVALPFERSDLHDNETRSCCLAPVVVQPRCVNELLRDSVELRNFVEDMVLRQFLHFGPCGLPVPSHGVSQEPGPSRFLSPPPARRLQQRERTRRGGCSLSKPGPFTNAGLPLTVSNWTRTSSGTSCATSPTPAPISQSDSSGPLTRPL